MNILLMVLGYFLYTMFGGDKEKFSLSDISLDKLAPLFSLFTGGGLNLGALLESDLLKNLNFLGMDMSKIAPIVELLASFSKSGGAAADKKTEDAQDAAPLPDANAAEQFPLAPISDIADKNITYSLTRYLSEKK